MSQILGVKFTGYGQVYYFSSGAFVVRKGEYVLVRTDQGMGMGEVVDVREEPPQSMNSDEIKAIYRMAADDDLKTMADNQNLSREAFFFCKKSIAERKLEMKLVDVEVFFDRSKMVFYFTAPSRIDFRELVKDLVREYRTRIELRQIGVRHETQMLGAIGNCGQLCCCRRFMRKFVPVTIKMAKEQNLFLNPTKISGICGRLLCCLSFEQEHYIEFRKRCPKIGRKYHTALGHVKVIRSNFFKKTLSLILEGGEEREVNIDEWEAITAPPDERGDSVFGLPQDQPQDAGPPARKARPVPGDRERDGDERQARRKPRPKGRRKKERPPREPREQRDETRPPAPQDIPGEEGAILGDERFLQSGASEDRDASRGDAPRAKGKGAQRSRGQSRRPSGKQQTDSDESSAPEREGSPKPKRGRRPKGRPRKSKPSAGGPRPRRGKGKRKSGQGKGPDSSSGSSKPQ